METSLHKQLKHRYASEESQTEVVFEGYRIDAIADNDELIEIQHASLGALRDKTRKLLDNTNKTLRIVKPILARKRVSTLDKPDGDVIRSRMSPKRGEIIDVFEDLVHFTSVFPMRRLILEVLLVETEELRIDRERPSRRGKKYKTLDQRLTSVDDATQLCTKSDLVRLLPHTKLPKVFDTSQLAEAIARPRWFAQKVAYCLRETGAAKIAGKAGNSLQYSLMSVRPTKSRKKPAA